MKTYKQMTLRVRSEKDKANMAKLAIMAKEKRLSLNDIILMMIEKRVKNA